MPKQRAPISTRLRNKDKVGVKKTPTQDVPQESIKREEPNLNSTLTEDNIIFSPRVDTDIYLDELQSPLSFVRGTDEERNQYLKEEDEIMSQSFGSDYKSSLNTSSFYYAQLSAPVPSKRTRHIHKKPSISSVNKRSNLMRESIKNIQIPFPMTRERSISPLRSSPSLSSPSTTPTPTPAPAIINNTNPSITTIPKGKKTISSMNSRIYSTPNVSKSTRQSISTRGAEAKSSKTKKSETACPDTIANEIESLPSVPLPMSRKLPVYIKMDAKDKEREYWRRQRRVFVHSRFLTNEEGVQVAKSVYSNLSIGPFNRMVTSMQGNIANFRTKLRRIFLSQTKKFDISEEYINDTKEEELICDLTLKMNDSTLKYVWEHWITDPFVDAKEFYSDKSSVNLLRDLTVKIMIICFKEQFNILSPRQARTEMRKLDLISRTIKLPDPTEYGV